MLINTILNRILKTEQIYSIHFVGIGGISMYSLAIYLKKLGHNVTGSDLNKSKTTNILISSGVNVQFNNKVDFIKRADVVIYSFACERGEEVAFAKQNNIPIFSRAELLGEVLQQYKTKICIAGAHGKTTTTALIFSILKNAGLNVDLHLGGFLADGYFRNLRTKQKDIIVCEACEYKDAFLNLKPTIAVITNIAEEHLDYFKNFENIKKSFNKFSLKANMLVCENLHIFKNKNTITFGENGSFSAKNIKILKNGTLKFDCYKMGKLYETLKLNLIGEHNVKNALSAIAVCDNLKVNKQTIKQTLKTFKGVERRFQILSKTPFIVHDYAHHPEEVCAVIKETKKFFKGNLIIVFQPHTYSRTLTLMEDFVRCFKNEKEVVIYKTYSAREKYNKKGSALTLSKNIGNISTYFKNKQKIIEYLKEKSKQNYGILLLGAGNIDIIAKNLAKLC